MLIQEIFGDTVGVIVDPARNAGSEIALGIVVQRKGDHTVAQSGHGYRAGPHSGQTGTGTCVVDVLTFLRPSASSQRVEVAYHENLELFEYLDDARLAGPATTGVAAAAFNHMNAHVSIP